MHRRQERPRPRQQPIPHHHIIRRARQPHRQSPRRLPRPHRLRHPPHRLVRRVVAAIDDHVRFAIDRVAAAPSACAKISAGSPLRQQRPRRDAARPAAAAPTAAPATTPTPPAPGSLARVAGSMNAPPPVASTIGRPVQQPPDHPPLPRPEMRLPKLCEHLRHRPPGRRLDLGMSESRNGSPSRGAKRRPIADFPAPISPTKTMLRPWRRLRYQAPWPQARHCVSWR